MIKSAKQPKDFTEAYLKVECREAEMFAIRNTHKKVITKDFLYAIDKIIDS